MSCCSRRRCEESVAGASNSNGCGVRGTQAGSNGCRASESVQGSNCCRNRESDVESFRRSDCFLVVWRDSEGRRRCKCCRRRQSCN